MKYARFKGRLESAGNNPADTQTDLEERGMIGGRDPFAEAAEWTLKWKCVWQSTNLLLPATNKCGAATKGCPLLPRRITSWGGGVGGQRPENWKMLPFLPMAPHPAERCGGGIFSASYCGNKQTSGFRNPSWLRFWSGEALSPLCSSAAAHPQTRTPPGPPSPRKALCYPNTPSQAPACLKHR